MARYMKHFKRMIRRAFLGVWSLLIVAMVFFNARLYSPSPLAQTQDQAPPELIAQLAANRVALDAGAPTRMQKLFPEGYYFSYLFHGLTWVELGMRDESYAKQAITEATWCLAYLESPEAKAPFPAQLPPDHGMFYSAWKCSLRAGIVVLQQGRDPEQAEALRQECDAIVAALNESESPFPPSYKNSIWPCDTVPAIHALSAYDHVFNENRYTEFVTSWLEQARRLLDSDTGLLPHTANKPVSRDGWIPRATSQVIMLRLLPDIDAAFARLQYIQFRKRFLTTFFGVPCVLEYPSGTSGPSDVDSGPLIFGKSLSATVFAMGVAQVYGDQSLANAIAQADETVGLPWTSNGRKRYMLGALPIGDIMVAYAQVARPWFAENEHRPSTAYHVGRFWRCWIHMLSLIVFSPVVFILWRRTRNKIDGGESPNIQN
jgi:hypothetical protein